MADFGGPEGAPLIVALHGLGGSHMNWVALAPFLTHRARVWGVDLVGHGRTPRQGRAADIAGHVALVRDVLATVEGPVTLMGNSMGGLVAALVASECPRDVDRLILVDPALPTDRLAWSHPRILANFALCAVPLLGETFLTQRRRWTSPEQSVRRVLATCCVDASRVPADVVAAHVALVASGDRAAGDDAYLRSARSLSLTLAWPGGVRSALDRITQPVLYLQGAADILTPLAGARQVAAAHPAWRFEVAEDVGHVPMLEAPVWTATTITEWLDALDAEGQTEEDAR